MKVNRLVLGFLAVSLFGSSAAFAGGGGGNNAAARQCLSTSGSGSGFTYSYKNPGWDGKACTKAVKVWACKAETCKNTSKGSDNSGGVGWNKNFRPGFTPKSSAVDWE